MLAIASLSARAALGGDAYLSEVGPPPLRFAVQTTPNSLILEELELPKPKAPEPIALPKPTAGGKAPEQGQNAADANTAGDQAGILGDPAKNAANFSNPASEMLNVTPQMLTQYLKPNRGEGSGADESGQYQPGQSILVPAELGFVPPLPGGNRAIYISK